MSPLTYQRCRAPTSSLPLPTRREEKGCPGCRAATTDIRSQRRRLQPLPISKQLPHCLPVLSHTPAPSLLTKREEGPLRLPRCNRFQIPAMAPAATASQQTVATLLAAEVAGAVAHTSLPRCLSGEKRRAAPIAALQPIPDPSDGACRHCLSANSCHTACRRSCRRCRTHLPPSLPVRREEKGCSDCRAATDSRF